MGHSVFPRDRSPGVVLGSRECQEPKDYLIAKSLAPYIGDYVFCLFTLHTLKRPRCYPHGSDEESRWETKQALSKSPGRVELELSSSRILPQCR